MSNDTAGHPRIDFAWGNMPMQPNTERGINPLDPVLDSHEIAYLGWNGFPDYVPNTTHTNSGSGSGGSGPSLVQVPALLPLESFISYRSRLQALGLVSQESSSPNLDSALVNETVIPVSVYPNPGQSVPVGTTVAFVYLSTFPATYTFPLYFSTPWVIAQNGQVTGSFSLAYGALPSDVTANPTNYRINLSGFTGPFAGINGNYDVTAVSQNGLTPLFTISGLTLPNGTQSLASSDAASAQAMVVLSPIA